MYDHILTQLSLPDRYERLEQRLGEDVAKLLTQPEAGSIQSLKEVAADVITRDEGVLIPVLGKTGIGKTTFAENLSHWVPESFTPTLTYNGRISSDSLSDALKEFSKKIPANNSKIIPINIDHRENSPPTDEELSAIKRYLRTKNVGAPSVILWPETNFAIANQISQRYISIAGKPAIDLPLNFKGPPQEYWQEIAKHTLSIANKLENLETLGIDPQDFKPQEFSTLGEYLRRLSQEFNRQILQLKSAKESAISLVIAFASESSHPGVLSQITSSVHYGLLDSHALISVTPQSVIGRWWAERRGLLTRAIVQMNVRAICLAPTAAASCIRNIPESMPIFDEISYRKYGPARAVRDLARSDLGKIVLGEKISRFEARGTPGDDASTAFKHLGKSNFTLGKDKNLNAIMASAIEKLLTDKNVAFSRITHETSLPFCPIIPDNAIFFDDRIICIEYTWRNSDFLSSAKRSTVAQYILEKIKNYTRELGWHSD